LPSSRESHGVIRRAYTAFAARDIASLRELADPEIEIRAVTAALAHGGEPYRGVEGVEQYMRDVGEVWDELELLPHEFHDLDGERTLVFGRVRARRGTTLIDSPNAWLWRLRTDRILSAEVFGDPESAVALLAEGDA
jgi:ketosteroid isomerase-like protein